LPGALSRPHFVPVIDDFRPQGRQIGAEQALYGRAIPEMRLHDLRHVGRPDAGLPGALGIDNHVRTVLAEAERTADRDLDFVVQATGGDFPAQRFDDLGRSMTGTARHSFGLLLIADKHVKTKRFHGGSPA
jgi:hypothetical protein